MSPSAHNILITDKIHNELSTIILRNWLALFHAVTGQQWNTFPLDKGLYINLML